MRELLEILIEKGLNVDEITNAVKNYCLSVDSNINFTNNSPNIFLLDALSIISKSVNNEIQLVRRDLSLENSEGVALHNMGFLASGILPVEESKTSVKTLIEGENGLILKKGFEIKDNSGNKFNLKNEIIVQNTNIYQVILEATEGNEERKFVLKFEKTTKSFSATGSDWANTLKNNINYSVEVNFFCGASIEGDKLTITAREKDFNIFLSSGLKYTSLQVSGFFEADKYGAINFTGMPIFETQAKLKKIDVLQILLGTERQGDEDYRDAVFNKREDFGTQNNRLKNAIKKENPSITSLMIFENDDASIDKDEYDIPYKHIECVVEGGEEQSLAYSIWNHKRSVSTFGNVGVRITDDFGKVHMVKYSRPENVLVSLEVVIKSEQPIDKSRAEEFVKMLVPKFVEKNNKIGTAFSLGRLSAFIVENFPEADKADIKAKTNKEGTQGTDWTINSIIKVKYKEILLFDNARLQVAVSNELKRK